MYWHAEIRGAFEAPAARQGIDLQCLLRSTSDSHNCGPPPTPPPSHSAPTSSAPCLSVTRSCLSSGTPASTPFPFRSSAPIFRGDPLSPVDRIYPRCSSSRERRESVREGWHDRDMIEDHPLMEKSIGDRDVCGRCLRNLELPVIWY